MKTTHEVGMHSSHLSMTLRRLRWLQIKRFHPQPEPQLTGFSFLKTENWKLVFQYSGYPKGDGYTVVVDEFPDCTAYGGCRLVHSVHPARSIFDETVVRLPVCRNRRCNDATVSGLLLKKRVPKCSTTR